MRINVSIAATVVGWIAFIASAGALHTDAGEFPRWQAPAQRHRLLRRALRGTLVVDDDGLEVRSAKLHERWGYVNIRGFEFYLKDLTLNTDQNRPGTNL